MPWQAGSRVLIVDSDLGVRLRLYTKLLEVDIYADCVATIGEALSALDDARYAVVVLDLGAPGERETLVGRLAAMPIGERPIVIATGAADTARNMSAEVVQIVFRRPMSVPTVAELIQSCLRPSGKAHPPPPPAKGDQPAS